MNMESSTRAIAVGAFVSKCRRISQTFFDVFEDTPDLAVPFAYLPLHYAPEISDCYFGTLYDHHEGFVTQLAKFIPSHMYLYVKEHTSMLGRRPTSFYRNLARLPNVRIIHPQISTFDLMAAAAVTMTVTGTAGWEAFLLGKPVVALGNVFYNYLPGVLHCPLNMDFSPKLADFLNDFQSSQMTSRNAYRACYASSFPGVTVDIGHSTTYEKAVEDAQNYARQTRLAIEQFGPEIGSSFGRVSTCPAMP
jgi:hypothetical protein